MEKIAMYGNIKEELGVVMAFAKLHEELGFPKLVPSKSRGFDIDDIEYKGHRVTLEFEYTSDNFINHGHVLSMLPERNYVLVCYEDNCNIIQKVRDKYKKSNLEVIELKNYIDIKQETITDSNDSLEYIVLNYNPYVAGMLTIDNWTKTNVFGIDATFKDNKIVPGSKILFKQGNEIVAGCDVVRYEMFNKPTTDNEWKLFASLLNYPVGLYNLNEEELKESFAKGYIFYDNFTVFKDRKVKFSEKLPNKQMSHQGMIKINKEEYDLLLGN